MNEKDWYLIGVKEENSCKQLVVLIDNGVLKECNEAGQLSEIKIGFEIFKTLKLKDLEEFQTKRKPGESESSIISLRINGDEFFRFRDAQANPLTLKEEEAQGWSIVCKAPVQWVG